MRDRIFAPESKINVFEELSKTKQGVEDGNGIFKSNKDLFIFAAALGFKHGEPKEVKKRGTEIPLSVFQRTKANIDFIDMIAVAATNDVYMLDWEDDDVVEKKLKLIEGYAHTGLEIIEKAVLSGRAESYDNLLQLISHEIKSIEESIDISDLSSLEDLI